ncbi:MAG: DNA primase [Flavobacteriales bacterium]|jgi:DNA primase|nr:DNA primase [Flavobacteriales bacterium]NCG29607.1 DNA primase [Bacteroidota bacterium]MBT3964163.1 DNA primase [Flavobacteriales bacterium]MBT4706041.1 DNA primase [Flavobacteriales bacterium]MBT4931437.1 DNA primase [Flavobacteriales bacterium]
MIPPHKVDEILSAARIDEVIGEFVNLKKSGSSLKGLSPWTDEKSPSFMVSPAKGIFKDFSSGKGGNVVSFIMEHEHFTYPEALRWLAKRYSIEIEEEKPSPEMEEARNERESLYVINEFARDWFAEQMWESDEGQNVGLSYFKERGFTETIIKKFQLGYNPDDFQAFTDVALAKGYKDEYLLATALVKEKNDKKYDGYKGRVIFPIHNLSGRVIGFGGRTLKADKNIPKYINSPENAIYNKSASLYGLYYAKQAIAKGDVCYLVEGYTDVISFHQKGVENTVASSGTALTRGQIKLISRYTQNITLVYDGDPAGIKASLRGIDLILEEGMHVKVVLLPDGHDPDSFSKEHDGIAIKEHLEGNARDFIGFKADLLMTEAAGDPIKTNDVIHAMVDSIALIPDTILRSLYITECSRLMDVSETALISELNKVLRKNHRTKFRGDRRREEIPEAPLIENDFKKEEQFVEDTVEHQERDLLRIMVNYYDQAFQMEDPTGEDEEVEQLNILEFLIDEIQGDDISFETESYQKLFSEVAKNFNETKDFQPSTYIHHEDEVIRNLFIDLMSFPYNLDNWERKDIWVSSEEKKLRRAVIESIYAYKSKRIERMIKNNQELMKDQVLLGADPDDFLITQMKLEEVKLQINKTLGRTILH